MLNNHALLLLVSSLLAACSGTTGSGNMEISMQSNSPATNTTSIPTTEAENPPPATGDAVRVARWSRDPKAPVLLAPLKGHLAIVNNCLVMQDHQGAPPTLLIFPYDSGVWNDAKRTLTFEGKVIGLGELIEATGGSLQNPNSLKEYGKYDLPDCGANHFFRVF